MARAYIRVMVDLVDRKVKAGYTSDQIVAYLQALLKGALQPEPGHYANPGVLKGWLGRYDRQVGFLQKQQDLVPDDDGGLYLEGWTEVQEGDLTVADRMKRYRERQRAQKTLPLDVPVERNVARKDDRNALRQNSAYAIANANAIALNDKTRVFDSWAASLPAGSRVTFTDERKRKIAARLERYPVEDLELAVSIGWQNDPWEKRPQQNDLVILLRSDEQAEKFINLAKNGAPSTPLYDPNGRMARSQRRVEALDEEIKRLEQEESK